jgi:stage II sporulation protein D
VNPKGVSRRIVFAASAAVLLALSVAGCQPEELAGLGPSQQPGPAIRVKLGDDEANMLVSVHGPFQLYDLKTRRLINFGKELSGALFSVGPTGLLLDGRPLDSSAVVVVAADADKGVIEVRGNRYCGNLRILVREGNVSLANVLDLDRYLASVVGQESYPHWHLEAMKAQAIAARSYALYQMKQATASSDFDLYSSVRSQAYPGVSSENATAREGVRQTRGVVLSYNDAGVDKVLPAFYHSTCGGRTFPADRVFNIRPLAPLCGVTCAYCQFSKYYRWEAGVGTEDVANQVRQGAAVANLGPLERVALSKEDLTPDGRVRAVSIWTAGQTQKHWTMPLGRFKELFPAAQPLRSDRFTVALNGKTLTVSGSGYGHGVGMCQYGSEGQARLGRTAAGILNFYYPGSKLVRVY